MKIKYPGLCFLSSQRPVAINTDGVTTTIPGGGTAHQADRSEVLVLPVSSARLIQEQNGSEAVFIQDSLNIPTDLDLPELFDGSQELNGKKVLIIVSNGWGDIIRVQPVFRLFFENNAGAGRPPRITLACNWIRNFPYPDSHYFFSIRPNVLTLEELCNFDVMVNLTFLNHQRHKNRSMKDFYLQALGLAGAEDKLCPISLSPDVERVKRLRPILQKLRSGKGKKLLYINWKARFQHKNAPPELAFEIAGKLESKYHAVIFKDRFAARTMRQEVRRHKAPVQDLSFLAGDFHDTIAAISLVDAVVSVDTGIIHAAGAMGIPGAALFGPFPPETHISDYQSIVGVSAGYKGRNCSGPCEETHRGCAEIGFVQDRISPCFEAIKLEEVIEALDQAFAVREK